MCATIFHVTYVQILHHEPFNGIRETVKNISDWVSDKFHLWQHEASTEKTCQIVIISQISVPFEKLNIFFLISQTLKILGFLILYFNMYKFRDVFLKTTLFGKKWNDIFIWLGSVLLHKFYLHTFTLTLHDGGRYHIETSPLICSANQWTGFYMITASVMKGLSIIYCSFT